MQIRFAFVYLCITVITGILLRSAYVISPFFNYQFLLHTHSHVAILGWIYTVLTALLSHSFLDETYSKKHRNLFLFTQIAIVGMLFSFPFQGYGFFSILFSSLFLVASYIYCIFLIKNTCKKKKKTIAFRFVKAGIFFLVFSSIGIWALPVIIMNFGKENALYQGTIYFFLHFQYNGFILCSLTALWVQQLEQMVNNKLLYRFLYGNLIGILGTVFLSWTGIWKAQWLYWVGGISAFIWFISLLIISKLYFTKISQKTSLSIFFVGMFLFKTFILLVGAIPYTAEHIFFNTDIIISYLHFTFLGVITSGILYFLKEKFQILFPRWSVWLYGVAFVSTETLILYKGIAVWWGMSLPPNYFVLLLVCSTVYIVVFFWTKWLWKNFPIKIQKEN